MRILQNSHVPDHATIAHFQNERLSAVMENLFYQLVLKLSELGEAEFKNVFVDGTKIEANANRYTFVWANAVQKNMNRLYDRIDRELPGIALKYGLSESAELEEVIGYLEKFCPYVWDRICARKRQKKDRIAKGLQTAYGSS